MRAPRRLVGAVIVILAWSSVALAGPTGLSRSIVSAGTTLTSQQRQTIDQFVQGCVDQLVDSGSTDLEVAQAQRNLSAPMRDLNATAVFIEAYVPRVAGQLAAALNANNRPIVRLNAMIVAASLSEGFSIVTQKPKALGSSGLIGVIEIGLDDPDAYVRYWAAKAAVFRKDYQTIDDADQRKLLVALRDAAKQETWAPAVKQCFLGMNKLTIADADDAVLEVLNQRIVAVAAQPDQSLRGDYEGMTRLYRKMVQAQDNSQNQKTRKALARIIYLYLTVVTDALGQGTISPDNIYSCKEVVLLADAALPYFCKAGPPGGTMKGLVERKDWFNLQVQAPQWYAPLQEKFKFTDTDLKIPAVAANSN